VKDQRVDLLYRDIGVVLHWLDEAEAGRYEVDQVEGYLGGMGTYVLAGELALAELLAGELPRPGFPGAHATTSFRARGCSPRPPSRLHRRRSPSAASGR
jgi:hypothetical protein